MPQADIPHLAWPFRFDTTIRRLSQVEQDSLDDVRQNVASYLSTEPGERPLSPDTGLEDPTFGSTVSPQEMADAIMEAEERAEVEVEVFGPDGSGRVAVNVHVELAE